MHPNSSKLLGALTQAAIVANGAGQDTTIRALGNARTGFFVLEISATVTTGGVAPTAILNDGSLWALFNQVAVIENGQDVVRCDARSMARVTELLGFAPSDAVRATSLVLGAFPLTDRIVIPFAWPLGVNPWETPFVPQDSNAPLNVGIRSGANIASAVGTLFTTAGTAVVSLLNINITQIYDTQMSLLPLFRPFMADKVSPQIAAVVNELIFPIDYPDVLRAIMLEVDTPLGTVGDAVTGYQIRGESLYVDGNGSDLNFPNRVAQQVQEFAGAISASRINRGAVPFVNPGFLFRNMQGSGRISNCLPRGQIGANPVILLTGNVSASGVTTVRATMIRLQKVNGVTTRANLTAAGQPVPV